MISKLAHCILSFFLIFGVLHAGDCADLANIIDIIPQKDRVVLTDFLKGMLTQGDFADVLLGEKPASLHGWPWWMIKAPTEMMQNMPGLIHHGLQIWKRYEHLIDDAQFFFVRTEYENGALSFWFVKKAYTASVLQGKSPSSYIDHLQIGALLGYPRNDVEGFVQQTCLGQILQFFPYEVGDQIKLFGSPMYEAPVPLKNSELDPIIQLKQLNSAMKLRPAYQPGSIFFPTKMYAYRSFLFEAHENNAWKEKIADLYNSDDFLYDILTIIVGA